MHASSHRLRTLALGALVGAVGAVAFTFVVGDREPAAAAADGERRLAETKTQRSGGFAYVKTAFPLPPGLGARGDAFCPGGSQLTGAFASGGVAAAGTTLPATIVRADGGDRDRVKDNGVHAFIDNPTGSAGEGVVDAICKFTKKKRGR